MAANEAAEGPLGGAEVKIDSKGRFLVPKAIQRQLGDAFVLARGQVGSLNLYPRASWDSLVALIQSAKPHLPSRGTLERLLLAGAREGKLDVAGRLLVPPEMRSFANMRDRVVLVGLSDRVEAWSSDEFEEYQANPKGYRRERQEALADAFAQIVAI